jgi:hypothetical protein
MDQYLCMGFAQLTYRESLRDIEACLRSRKEKLYHLGIRGRVSRSTLAEANEKRDWRMYADFCQILISQARSLYTDEDFGVELKETARFSHQQFRPSSIDNRQTLQVPMANRIVLQMDQATSSHKGLLRNIRQCSKNRNLDRRFYLRPCCHHPKTPPPGDESLHNFTDPECHPIRKSAA